MAPEEVALPGYSGFVEVARGGDSVVYRARQDGLGRDVAVKVLALDEDPATVARFRRELEITVGLGRQHPNIVTVIDTGTVASGRPCLVMEYYDRGSLHDRLQEHGAFPIEDVIEVGRVMADALAFAHGQGVLHRDVKPQNILVLPTSYVLADFGLARGIDAGHSVSLERFSYRHAAPQILDGETPTVTDDIYSLGSTLYTLLDGRPPFAVEDPDSDSALSYLRRVRSDPPRPLSRMDVPIELADIVTRCLAKQRSDRFPDAASVRAALAAVRLSDDPWAPPRRGTSRIAARLAGTKVVTKAVVTASEAPKPQQQGASAPAPAVPIATSALAHLENESPPLPADVDTTGTAPRPEPPVEEPPARRSPWRRIAVVGLTAIAVGTVAGVVMAMLRGAPEQPSGEQRPTGGWAVPTYTSELPPQSGLNVDVSDPKLAATIITLEDRSTSAVVRWTDPSEGRATFVLTRRAGNKNDVVAQIPKGTTSFTVEGLDPAASQYCFQVIAIVDSARRGASPERCTGIRR
ncbi:protein kinase domain-containing protein [Kibdelosporangium aridum]|nr:protein kinase [Kibdelosporangium aridum]